MDCGDDVADWLQMALGRSGVRLTRQDPHDTRVSKRREKGNHKLCYTSNHLIRICSPMGYVNT